MNRDSDKYHLLIENLPDAFAYHQVITDDDGKPVDYIFLEANTAFEEMTGLERSEVIGKKVTQVHPKIRKSALDWIGVYGKVAQGGGSIRFEKYFEPSDRWYEVCAYSDEPGYFVAVFRDISKHKDMENDLKDTSGKLKAIIDNSPLLISEFDPGGQYLMANKAVADLLNREASEVVGIRFEDFLPPETVDLFNKRVSTVVSKKKPIRVDDQITVNDKSYYYMTTLFPLLDSSGRVVSIGSIAHDITDRIETETVLRENEELLRTVTEIVGEGIALKNASDSFVHWNKTASDIFGLDIENARGQTPAVFHKKFIYEDGTEYAGDDYPSQYTLRTGEPCNNVIMGIKRSNHTITWLKINTRPIFKAGDAKPYLVAISFSDITEQKEKENQLRKSKELLARSQQIAHIGSWNLDLRTKHLTWTDEVYRIFGIRPQEFAATYEAFLNAVHPDDRMAVNEAYTSSIRDGRDEYAIEHRIVRRDTGEIRIVHERCVHERDDAGTIIRSIGMVQDITERKQAEEALQVRERFLDRILQTTIDGFWVVDNQKRIIQVNDAYCTMSGYSREELLGMTINDLEVDETPEDTAARIKQIIESGSDLFETHHQRKDGTIFPLEISVTYLAKNGGQMICFCRDISERRKIEEELKRQAAERAAVDTFTYSVSNDLQAPLRRIEGFSEALLEECPDELSGQAHDYLNRITTQISSMKKLTDALLQLSRVVSREIDREKVDLSALTRSNIEKLQHEEPERQLELAVTPGLITEGDAELLNLMLAKLLDNAWKFTSEAEETKIEFGSEEQNGRTVYYLKDNGIGFKMSHAEKLFTPFQKLHSGDAYPGIGIGLNLAFRILSRHGGEIWAEGEPGKGACFYFTLP